MGEITALKLTTREILRLIELLENVETYNSFIQRDIDYLVGKLRSALPSIDYIAEEALIASGSGN